MYQALGSLSADYGVGTSPGVDQEFSCNGNPLWGNMKHWGGKGEVYFFTGVTPGGIF